MSCYHPLKAFPIGITNNNKTKYKITSYDVDYVYLDRSELNWKNGYFFNGDNNPDHYRCSFEKYVDDYIEIPCGQCIGCRFDRSRQWANRCMLELPYHKSSYFVTLTYNEEKVIHSGGKSDSLTLCKREFQLFMKRLRKSLDELGKPKIRFFACGEYGSKTFRPHYHAIIFGLELPADDLQFWSVTPFGYNYYRSPYLESVWQNGNVIVGEVNWETCAYTARYVVKKYTGENAKFYEVNNIEPPFSLMSRKPGIAYWYFKDNPDLYDFDYINISTKKKGLKFPLPKYFDYLESLSDPEFIANKKASRREQALIKKAIKLERTDKSYLEMLADEEQAFKDKTKILLTKGRIKADA